MAESVDAAARKSTLSVTSLALALVALAVCWPMMIFDIVNPTKLGDGVFTVGGVAAVILGVGAVVTGLVARRRVKRGNAGKGRVALAGIVLGIVAAVVPALLLASAIYGLYYRYDEFRGCLRGSGYPKYMCLKECPEFFDSWCHKAVGW